MYPPLERRRIGATEVYVPVLGVGCSPFGNRARRLSLSQVDQGIAAAFDVDATYFDVAPYYGFGLCERRVGDALRERQGDDYVISTKVGRLLVPDSTIDTSGSRNGFLSPMPFRPMFDYSYDGIMRSFEASLHRLGLSRIDILLVHDLGRFAHGTDHDVRFRVFLDSGYRALEALRSGGAVQAIGLGVNECAVCEELMDVCAVDCFLIAGRYTLLDQTALERLLPRCLANEVSVIAGGPYNTGLLAGGTQRLGPLMYDYGPAPEEIIGRLRSIEAVCATFSIPIAAAALQFPLAHPAISAVLPGINSSDRMLETRSLLDFPIPMEFWEQLRSHALIDARAPLQWQEDAKTFQ